MNQVAAALDVQLDKHKGLKYNFWILRVELLDGSNGVIGRDILGPDGVADVENSVKIVIFLQNYEILTHQAKI